MYINNHKIGCLVDSGCNTCLIRNDIFDLVCPKNEITKSKATIRVANQSTISSHFASVVNLKIDSEIDNHFRVKAFKNSNIRHPMILGTNIFDVHSIHRSEGIVRLDNIPTPLISENRVFKLATFQEESLKPNQINTIYANNPLSNNEINEFSACLIEKFRNRFFY